METLGVGILLSYAVSGAGAITSMDSQMKKLFHSTGALAGKLTSLGKSMVAVGAGAVTLAAGVGLIKAGLETASTFADYEYELARVQGLIGATSEEMQIFEDQARSMASVTGTTAAESMRAYYELLSSGLSSAEAVATLEATLKTATIGQMESAESADMLTTAMRAFNLEAEDSMFISDRLVAGSRMSKIHLDEYTQAFGRSGAVMAGLNQSLEGTIALFGLMRTAGLSGSSASMMVKMLGTNLMKISDDNLERLKGMGVEIYNLQGEMRPLVEIFEEIYTAMPDPTGALASGLITEDQVRDYAHGRMRFFGDVFGMRAVAGFLSIKNAQMDVNGEIMNGTEVLSHFMNELETGSEGFTESYFAIMMDTWKQKMLVLKAVWNNVLLSIGEPIINTVSPYLDKLMETATYVSDFLSANPQIASAIGAGLLIGGALLALAGGIVALGGLIGLLAGFAKIIGIVALVVVGIGIAVAFIGAIGYAIYSHWDKFKELMISLGDWLWTKFDFIVYAIVGLGITLWVVVIRPILGFLKTLLPIVLMLVAVVSAIIGAVLIGLDVLWGLIQTIFAFFIALFTWDWEGFDSKMDEIWFTIADEITVLSDLFFDEIGGAILRLAKDLIPEGSLMEGMTEIATSTDPSSVIARNIANPAFMDASNWTSSNAAGKTTIPSDGLYYGHEGEEIVQRGGHSNQGSGSQIANVNFYSYGKENPESFARRAYSELKKLMNNDMEATQYA